MASHRQRGSDHRRAQTGYEVTIIVKIFKFIVMQLFKALARSDEQPATAPKTPVMGQRFLCTRFTSPVARYRYRHWNSENAQVDPAAGRQKR